MKTWIKFTDKKPTVGKEVLVAIKNCKIPIVAIYEPTIYDEKFFVVPGNVGLLGYVTHWQPLPSLPPKHEIDEVAEIVKSINKSKKARLNLP